MRIKLKRISDTAIGTYYQTLNGVWRIWREPYYPRRWFVNHRNNNETEEISGFASKREAVAWLEEFLATPTGQEMDTIEWGKMK